MLLASLLDAAPALDADNRKRARQLLGETRWLHQLHQAYEETVQGGDSVARATAEPVQVDLLAGDVVAAMRLATPTRIAFTADRAWVRVYRLDLWRGLRNMLDNAVRAAGESGRVEVRVSTDTRWVIVEVEDDGPGFGAGPAGTASLGLSIVRRVAADSGGDLEIRDGAPGGCRVRLLLPASAPIAVATTVGER